MEVVKMEIATLNPKAFLSSRGLVRRNGRTDEGWVLFVSSKKHAKCSFLSALKVYLEDDDYKALADITLNESLLMP